MKYRKEYKNLSCNDNDINKNTVHLWEGWAETEHRRQERYS